MATGAALLAWSAFGSTVQVLVYRRGLARWRAGAVSPGEGPAVGGPSPDSARSGAVPARSSWGTASRFDARAVTVAAGLVFALLLVSTSWALIAGAAAWLVVASLAAGRLERDALPAGLILAAVLAASGFAFSVVGGLGVDMALRRGARAGLLVIAATWLRAAAGSEGLREVARRALHRLRAVPSLAEAGHALDEIGAAPRLAAAGRTLFGSLAQVRKRPLPVVDAVLAWVRAEAGRFKPARPAAGTRRPLRVRDGLLVASAVLPGLGLIFAAA